MASVKLKLDEFFGYVESIAAEVSEKSFFGTSVTYALSMQDDRMAYLMDGRLTISSNYAEREAVRNKGKSASDTDIIRLNAAFVMRRCFLRLRRNDGVYVIPIGCLKKTKTQN